MTVREILKMGDPRLLRVAKPVPAFDTPELHALIADMFETMHAASGAGLAAPQIGVSLRVFTYWVDEEPGHLINPDLDLKRISFSGAHDATDGLLARLIKRGDLHRARARELLFHVPQGGFW